MVAFLSYGGHSAMPPTVESTSAACRSLRWAISLKETASSPHFELLLRRAWQALPEADVAAQRRFRYRDDALATTLGRVMIRRAVSDMLNVPWHSIDDRIVRSAKNKPEEVAFNVSHQGDLVVLTASTLPEDVAIGVDVMRLDHDEGGAEVRIRRLTKAFTPRERQYMLEQTTESSKWRAFYRIWCLKESVLKATGQGIATDLGALEFRLGNQAHEPGCFITSTSYEESGEPRSQFSFEESFIGDDHTVAVARILRHGMSADGGKFKRLFSMVDLSFLLEPSSAVNMSEDCAAEEFDCFLAKEWKSY